MQTHQSLVTCPFHLRRTSRLYIAVSHQYQAAWSHDPTVNPCNRRSRSVVSQNRALALSRWPPLVPSPQHVQVILSCHQPQCSFHGRGHNFQRSNLPTEICEVIYQMIADSDLRSESSPCLLFTFIPSSRAQCVWSNWKKEGSILLHQIPLFQFGKLCCHCSYLC